jgi:hypothetical protein
MTAPTGIPLATNRSERSARSRRRRDRPGRHERSMRARHREQRGHRATGAVLVAPANRIADGRMLGERRVEHVSAPRVQMQLRLQRAVDQRAERHQQLVAAGLEHAHVKAQVGAHPFVDVARRRHRAHRRLDRVEPARPVRAGGQRGRMRLDHLAHLLQLQRERDRRRDTRVPVEQVGIEQVPCATRPHARADLRPRFDQPLRRQRAQRLAQHRAAHAEHLHQVRLARQQRFGRIVAAQDRRRKPERRLSMQVALNDRSPLGGQCGDCPLSAQ